jgi:hypothetical protein
VVVCAVYTATTSFIAWGFDTPDLDRIWTLDHELKIGETWKLDDDDFALLTRSLKRHPGLAEALLSDTQIGIVSAHRDGWVETPEVTVIRTAVSSHFRFMRLDVETPERHLPMRLTVRADGWKHKLQADRRGPLFVPLPPKTESEVFTVDFKGKDLRADPSILRTRITFHEERE